MSEDEANLANISKIQRIEHGVAQGQQSTSPHQRLPNINNDFSGSVKRKLADSKRTGQACDRCKVRSDSTLHAHVTAATALSEALRGACLRGTAVHPAVSCLLRCAKSTRPSL